MRRLPLACVLLAPPLAALAAAPSAEDLKAQQARSEADLAAVVNATNEACGTKLKATLDWASLTPEVTKNYSVASYCQSTADALTKLCGGEQSKKYIQNTVKGLRCAYGGAGKRALSLKKGVVELVLDFDAGNYDDFARAQLILQL